jgi:hypothetical protein
MRRFIFRSAGRGTHLGCIISLLRFPSSLVVPSVVLSPAVIVPKYSLLAVLIPFLAIAFPSRRTHPPFRLLARSARLRLAMGLHFLSS